MAAHRYQRPQVNFGATDEGYAQQPAELERQAGRGPAQVVLPLPASAVAHGGHKIALREAYGVND